MQKQIAAFSCQFLLWTNPAVTLFTIKSWCQPPPGEASKTGVRKQQPTACSCKCSLTGTQPCPFLHRHFLGPLSHYNGELSCHDRPHGLQSLKYLLFISLQKQLANFLNVIVWRKTHMAPLLVAYIGATPLNFQSFYFFTYKMGEDIITGLLWGWKIHLPCTSDKDTACFINSLYYLLFP